MYNGPTHVCRLFLNCCALAGFVLMIPLKTCTVLISSQYVFVLVSVRFVLSSKSIGACLAMLACFLLTTSDGNL